LNNLWSSEVTGRMAYHDLGERKVQTGTSKRTGSFVTKK